MNSLACLISLPRRPGWNSYTRVQKDAHDPAPTFSTTGFADTVGHSPHAQTMAADIDSVAATRITWTPAVLGADNDTKKPSSSSVPSPEFGTNTPSPPNSPRGRSVQPPPPPGSPPAMPRSTRTSDTTQNKSSFSHMVQLGRFVLTSRSTLTNAAGSPSVSAPVKYPNLFDIPRAFRTAMEVRSICDVHYYAEYLKRHSTASIRGEAAGWQREGGKKRKRVRTSNSSETILITWALSLWHAHSNHHRHPSINRLGYALHFCWGRLRRLGFFLRLYLFFRPINVRRIWGKSIPSFVGGGKALARVTSPVSRLREVLRGRGNRAAADRRKERRQVVGEDGAGGRARQGQPKQEKLRWRTRSAVQGLGEVPT